MAVVGEAHIIVRAITTRVRKDIMDGFDGIDGIGGRAGADLGKKFSEGFNRSGSDKFLGKITSGLRTMAPEAERAREAWQKMVKTGYTLGPIIGTLVGAISALIGSLVSLVGAAGAAGASLVVLGNVFAGFGLAMMSAKIALGGVMQALGQMGKGGGGAAKATDSIRLAQQRLAQVIEQNNEAIIAANNRIADAQLNLNDALEAGKEELQQLGFAAEEAALAERGAALDLERAREELARVQDLPPNSRIRREAELAFAQAELQYREAVDANADLAKEQEKYATSGVEGTDQVIQARKQLAEAEANLARVVRDGLRAQLEAEKALQDARKGTAAGGADPFANLTKSQIDFVKRMYALKPLFKDVQEQIAKAFLPLLGDAVENFANNVLPTVGDGLADIGRQLGLAADRTSKFLSSAEGLSLLKNFFADSARLIAPMSDAFGQLMQVFLKLMHAAAPQAERFVAWIRDAFSTFNTYLDSLPSEGKGSLAGFFQDAGDAAAEFGDLFGEVFRFLGQIIKVNLGEDSPGRDFVRWMTDGLRAANDLRDSNLFGPGGLADYFAKVNENTKQILSSLGALGRVFIDIGDNPAIGQTFSILKEGAPALTSLFDKLAASGPSFAEFINVMVALGDALTDTDQINAFWNTLKNIGEAILAILNTAPVQKFIDLIGPLLGVMLALTTVLEVAKFAGLVLADMWLTLSAATTAVTGAMQTFAKAVFGTVFSALKTVTTQIGLFIWNMVTLGPIQALVIAGNSLLSASFKILGMAMKAVGIGALITLIAALVVGFLELMNSNEEFRKIFTDTFNKFKSVFAGLAPVFSQLSALFMKVVDAVMPLIMNLAKLLIPLLGKLMEFMAGSAGSILELLLPAVELLVNGLVWLIDAISWLVDGIGEWLGLGDGVHEFGSRVEASTDTASTGLYNMSDAGDTATTSLYGTADAVDTVGNSANSSAPKVSTFASGLGALKQSAIDAVESDINLRDALRSLSDELGTNGTKLYGNSEAADKNKKALIDAAKAVQEKMQADIDAGVPLDQVNQRYRENYEAIRQTAIDAGLSKKQVDKFLKSIMNLPALTTVELKLKTDDAQAKLDAWKRANGYTVQLAIKGIGSNIRAQGGLDTYTRTFASGGIAEGIYRSMARPLYKFAEPETGWEAFISGRKGSEERNRAIVREAASRLGMNMGGVNITVNPSPGMDERALAGAVSQEITKLMRKGSMY